MEQDDESDIYEHFFKEVLFPILDLLTETYGGGFIQTEEELDNLESFFVRPDSEYGFGFDFSPEWIDSVCYKGFFPMADCLSNSMDGVEDFPLNEFFLIKHHKERAVLKLTEAHFSKKLSKYSDNLEFSIDEDFEGCVKNILETYKKTWLTPKLVEGFRQLHYGAQTKYGTKVHSVEVWDKNTNELVAGEIGFRNGHLYTSLSGFRKRNHVGNIQMSALCKFLQEKNLEYWDFGMFIPYKVDLGCKLFSRQDFFALHKELKDKEVDFSCKRRPLVLM